jgi:hypothetical protein
MRGDYHDLLFPPNFPTIANKKEEHFEILYGLLIELLHFFLTLQHSAIQPMRKVFCINFHLPRQWKFIGARRQLFTIPDNEYYYYTIQKGKRGREEWNYSKVCNSLRVNFIIMTALEEMWQIGLSLC